LTGKGGGGIEEMHRLDGRGTSRRRTNMATAGRFTVKDGRVTGPRAYMESEQFRKTAEKIQDGTHCCLGMFPAGQDLDLSVAVIIQTDFAAWLGNREIEAMCGKRS
jgi:hypothetical protein